MHCEHDVLLGAGKLVSEAASRRLKVELAYAYVNNAVICACGRRSYCSKQGMHCLHAFTALHVDASFGGQVLK